MIPTIAVNYILVLEVSVIYNLITELSDFDSLVPKPSDSDSLALSEIFWHFGFIRGVDFRIFCFYLGEVRWRRIVWDL